MEDDNSPRTEFCVKNCGFYGNPIYNDMCSKCFKEANAKTGQTAEKAIEPSMPATAAPTAQVSAQTTSTEVPPPASRIPLNQAEQQLDQGKPSSGNSSVVISENAPTSVVEEAIQPLRQTQKNKARCHLCRAKIPLAKQTINKCRCEYVYCDIHKVPDKHDCDFDFAKMGKDILSKNNPKLNDVHKGGRSFNRID